MNRYEALRHAVKAHAGQLDKCGQPYILHPIAVAEALERGGETNDDTLVMVGLLHDVREDTAYELPSFGNYTDGILDALTHREDESYFDYITRICEHHWELGTISTPDSSPMLVKLADLWHNLQPERQGGLPEKERRSLEARYLKARDRIWEALGYSWWPDTSIEGSEGER